MMPEATFCGVCGRVIARYPVKRGPVTYQAWRHTDVTGLAPHTAVIGTPGRRATPEEMTEALGGDATAGRDLWDSIYGRHVDKAKITEPVYIPPPRIPGRLAEDHEIPASARQVITVAEDNGWDVRVIYSLGPVISSDGKGILRENESVSVRCHRGGQRCVAVWTKPWSPKGPVMVNKTRPCRGCRSTKCVGCAVGPGATVEAVRAGWEHDSSFLATPSTELVRLTDLKAVLLSPEGYCDLCGAAIGNHYADPRRGYVCPIQPEETP